MLTRPLARDLVQNINRSAVFDAVGLTLKSIALGGTSTWDGTYLDWTDAEVWRRDHDFIESMRVALGLTNQKVDELFIAAAEID